MISKTKMLALVEDLRAREVAKALAESPDLVGWRDKKGRNWLHVCCGVNPKKKKLKAADRVKTARVLLGAGLDLNGEAFCEGAWKATPLWYALARGKSLPVGKFLLDQGADPNHCLWAAAFEDDVPAIKLVVSYGAAMDPVAEGATPLLAAVGWSKFRAAEALLAAGADPDFQDRHGMTALHYMLKKGTDPKHFRIFIKHGARGDIPNAKGATAAEIMSRKRDATFRKMASQLATEDGY